MITTRKGAGLKLEAPPPIRSQGVEPDSWEEHSHPPPLPGGCLLGQSLLLTCSAAAEPWVRPSVALFFFAALFIYWLYWVSLLRGLFSSCSEWGYSPVAVRGLLIAVASLAVEHGL